MTTKAVQAADVLAIFGLPERTCNPVERVLAREIARLNDDLAHLRDKPGPVPLTPVQRDTLQFLRSYIEQHKVAPTQREVADALGLRSMSSANDHIATLERKGYLTRNTRRARAITLPTHDDA